MERQINKINTAAALSVQYIWHYCMFWYKAGHEGAPSVFEEANMQGTTAGLILNGVFFFFQKYQLSFVIIKENNYSWIPVFWLWTEGWALTDLDGLLSTSTVCWSHRGQKPQQRKRVETVMYQDSITQCV